MDSNVESAHATCTVNISQFFKFCFEFINSLTNFIFINSLNIKNRKCYYFNDIIKTEEFSIKIDITTTIIHS